MFFLLIVALLIFTAGMIWALHRNQLRRQIEVVERIKDLPPLESATLPDFTPAQAAPAAVQADLAAQAPQPVTTVAAPAEAQAGPARAAAPENPGWQDQIKLLKDKGDLDAALRLSQQHLPRAQAFQQAAILLRLRIRQQVEQRQDPQAAATQLYRCAVLADLFRSGAAPKPVNARQALKGLESVDFQYVRIGHQQLKLLTKSDIKLFEQLWGVPEQHVHAEQELGVLWQQLCRN